MLHLDPMTPLVEYVSVIKKCIAITKPCGGKCSDTAVGQHICLHQLRLFPCSTQQVYNHSIKDKHTVQ